jgi:hypothetical protein
MKSKNTFKFIFSGIVAFLVLNIFCFVYYNLPVHVTTKTGVTDYYWETHAYYSKMTEGLGYGKMNNEGFNNIQDYFYQPIDILLMGSSQMEGTNVPQKATTTALLNKLFETKYVYNIGISGHNFSHIVNNLETAIQFYKPNKYVIVEIGSLQFNVQSLEESINGTLRRIPSYDNKIMFFLQKIPYLRLLYSQYKNFIGKGDEENLQQSNTIFDMEKLSASLDAVMKKLYMVEKEYGIKIIIFYHPHFTLNSDGTISENTVYEYQKTFEDACDNNNILFFSMADVFAEEYNNNHTLPHGFSNTAVGSGHLNRNGHMLIADELFRQINNIEKDGSI